MNQTNSGTRSNSNSSLQSKNSNSNGIKINKQYSNNTGSNTGVNVVGIVLAIVILMLIIGSIYWAYGIYSSKKFATGNEVEALKEVKDASSKFAVGSSSIPSSNYSNEYSISMWVNVRDYTYNYGKEKPILRRGGAGSGNPEIVLGANDNDLIVRLKLQKPNQKAIMTATTIPPTTIPATTIPATTQSVIMQTTTTTPETSTVPMTTMAGSVSVFANVSSFEKPLNISKTQDNRAPYESQVFDNDYFSMISGNEVNKQTMTTAKYTREEFTVVPTGSVNSLLDASMHSDPTVGTCVYKMLPLQKWVSVIVSVYNQIVDIYIDGQLASSCVLNGFPNISTDSVDLTPDGGFSGQISRVVFSNTAMTASRAREIYYNGPVASTNPISMIPNWIWYSIILIIVVVVLYSVIM